MKVMCINKDGWESYHNHQNAKGPEFGETYLVIDEDVQELTDAAGRTKEYLFYMLAEFTGLWYWANDFIPVQDGGEAEESKYAEVGTYQMGDGVTLTRY